MQTSTVRQVMHHTAHAVMTWALRIEATLPHGLWCMWMDENESRHWKVATF